VPKSQESEGSVMLSRGQLRFPVLNMENNESKGSILPVWPNFFAMKRSGAGLLL
jgi:hypothetical protein